MYGPIYRRRWTIFVFGVLSISGCPLFGGDGISIEPVQRWSCFFGGRQTNLSFRVKSNVPIRAQASWSIAVRDQVVARRESTLTAAPEKPALLKISLQLPKARPNIVIPVAVTLRIGRHEPHTRRLFIYPDDPFTDRREALGKLRLRLFDPNRRTAAVFEKARIPFEPVEQVDSLASVRNGVVIIGAGISFREFRGLSKLLHQLLSRGVSVVCLAPRQAEFPLPGGHVKVPRPTRLSFSDATILHRLDKRFDAHAWPPNGRAVAGRLELIGDRTGVLIRTTDDQQGWSWLKADYQSNHSQLIISGLAIIGSWDSTPVARHALAKILQDL